MDEITATHTEKIEEKKKKKHRKLKKHINPTDQSNGNLHVIADTIEKKTTAKDEPVLELSKGDQVLTDEVKENSHNEAKKRKRKSTRKGVNKSEPEPMDQEHKDLVTTSNEKNCVIDEAGMGVGGVSLVVESPKVDRVLTELNVKDADLTVGQVLQDSAEVEKVSTEIVKEQQNPEGKKRRKKKSRDRNKDVKTVIDEEDKCLKISVDSKSCISADKDGVFSTVEPLLQESLKVGGVSTEMAKEVKIPEGKRKRKKKSKDMDEDEKVILGVEDKCPKNLDINGVGSIAESLLQDSSKVEEVSTEIDEKTPEGKQKRKKKVKAKNKDRKAILDEEGECLKASVNHKSCIAAAELGNNVVDSTVEPSLQESPNFEEASAEIVEKQETPEENQRKRKSTDVDEDEKVILGVEDKCPKILGINGVGSIAESLLQDSSKVEEVSTEIAEKIPEGKRKRKKKLKAKNKDGKAILDEEGECLKASVNSRSCIAAAELGNNGVDSTVEPSHEESPNFEGASAEIVEKQETPEENQRKRKSKDIDEDEKAILGVEDKCPKILGINGVGSIAESLLQGSSKVEEVSTEIAKTEKIPEGKRKRKKKAKAKNKDGKAILDEEGKCLKASVNSTSCIVAAELGNNGVDSTIEPLLQASPNYEEASTEIVKNQETLEEKQRKRKSNHMDEDEKVILGVEDKCPKISVDSKSCISADESGINGLGSTVGSLLQESLEVGGVATDIAKEVKIPEGKRKRKKSKAKNKDGKAILDEEGKCLKASVNSKSCIAAAELGHDGVDSTIEPLLQESPNYEEASTEIVKKQETPEEKQRKRKSMDMEEDEKVILGADDKCPKISVDSKSGISAGESGINGLGSTVESLLQESLKVGGVSTELAEEVKIPELKRKRKKKSKAKNTDGKDGILDEEGKCLKASVNKKSCIEVAELRNNGVDSTVEPLLQESPKVEEASTEIAKKQETPKEKQRRKRKSKVMDEDEKVILGVEDKSLKICGASKSCISSAESGINGVGSNIESLLQDSLKVEENLTEIAKEEKIPEGKQKRKKRSKAMNKDGKAIFDEEKCLKISGDSKSCLSADESGINGVGSTVESLLQESLKVGGVSTEIAKEEKTPEGKRKRKKKSKARNKDGEVIPNEEVKRLLVSVDGKSCTAAAESSINDVDSNVESLPQESPKVEEVSTDIAKKQTTPEKKQRRKRKSKDMDKDQKVIEEDKCLKVEEVSTEIAKKQKIPEEKQRRKRKSKDMDKDEKVILREDDNCLKICDDRKSYVAAAVSTTKDVDLKVEPLHQDFAMVGETSTEILIEKKSADGEELPRKKLKTSSEKEVEVLIRDQQNELSVTSIDGKCCTKTEMGSLQAVDSRSNRHADLSNDHYKLPQIPVTPPARRILLILDINGLLADIVMPPPKERKSDINIFGRAIFKRPYCDDFLDFCFDTFDVAIWSSRTKKNIDKVVDYLLGKRREKLLFCWDLTHTTGSSFKTLENKYKPLVCKSLRNVWEKRDPFLPWEKGDYTESNTLLIDDSPYKALLNPMHTAIFPYSFTYEDRYDKSLGPGGELREYLENLAKTDDVRRYVEQHPFGQSAITEKSPSWDFYSKVVKSLTRF